MKHADISKSVATGSWLNNSRKVNVSMVESTVPFTTVPLLRNGKFEHANVPKKVTSGSCVPILDRGPRLGPLTCRRWLLLASVTMFVVAGVVLYVMIGIDKPEFISPPPGPRPAGSGILDIDLVVQVTVSRRTLLTGTLSTLYRHPIHSQS